MEDNLPDLDIDVLIEQTETLIEKIANDITLINKYSKKIGVSGDVNNLKKNIDGIVKESINYGKQSKDILNLLQKTRVSKHRFNKIKKNIEIVMSDLETSVENSKNCIDKINETTSLISNKRGFQENMQNEQDYNNFNRNSLSKVEHMNDFTNVAIEEEKLHDITLIESDLLEIRDMTREINHMLTDQWDTLGLVTENIRHTDSHINYGNKYLDSAVKYDKSNRNLYCIIFIIIVCVVLFIIGCVAFLMYLKLAGFI